MAWRKKRTLPSQKWTSGKHNWIWWLSWLFKTVLQLGMNKGKSKYKTEYKVTLFKYFGQVRIRAVFNERSIIQNLGVSRGLKKWMFGMQKMCFCMPRGKLQGWGLKSGHWAYVFRISPVPVIQQCERSSKRPQISNVACRGARSYCHEESCTEIQLLTP